MVGILVWDVDFIGDISLFIAEDSTPYEAKE